MIAMLGLSILFAIGGVYNLITGDIGNFFFGMGITVVLFLIFLHFQLQEKKAEEFESWLAENVCKVYADKAEYKGMKVSLDTKITRFQFCLSLIFMTIKVPSGYLFTEKMFTVAMNNIAYTVCSLIFGWWGLPWGPIYTIQVTFSNIFGGKKMLVRQLITSEQLAFAQKVYNNEYKGYSVENS